MEVKASQQEMPVESHSRADEGCVGRMNETVVGKIVTPKYQANAERVVEPNRLNSK